MAQDPIREYSDAVKELEAATGKVELLQGITRGMNSYLNNPYGANNWPQIQQIAEALISLHEKREIAEKAWRNLSDTDRKLVSPLPQKKRDRQYLAS